MASRRSLWAFLPRPIRELPADLATMVLLTVSLNVTIFAPVIRETPLRIPLGLAFVLVAPGYAFVSALFPEAGSSPTDGSSQTSTEAATTPEVSPSQLASPRPGIDRLERAVLSFALSVSIVPLLVLGLNFTPWGIRLASTAVVCSGFVLVATAVAASRRHRVPTTDRFRLPYRAWFASARAELFEPPTRLDAALNVILVVSAIIAVGAVASAVVYQPPGEQFSAIHLLTEDENGDLVADDYPSELDLGEGFELVAGVDNREHESVTYEVVVLEQAIDRESDAPLEEPRNRSAYEVRPGEEPDFEPDPGYHNVTIDAQREVDRFGPTVDHNESWQHRHELEPTMTGEVRFVWLLYVDERPDEPSIETADYFVHVWVDVQEPSDEDANDGDAADTNASNGTDAAERPAEPGDGT